MDSKEYSAHTMKRLEDFEDELVQLEQEVNDHGMRVRQCSDFHYQLIGLYSPKLFVNFWCSKKNMTFRIQGENETLKCRSLMEMLERVIERRAK